MKTVVGVFCPPVDEGRKRRAAGVDAGWLAMKPVQEKPVRPDPAYRHIPFDLMTSIWSGATVGCIGAAVIPPFSEIGRRGDPA